MVISEKPLIDINPTPPLAVSSPASITDADLVERARFEQAHGQPNEAFALLYRRYLDRVYRFALIRTGSIQEDAQDITAQTFLAALQQLKSYQGKTFGAWLFGIARHKLADHFRRQKPELSLSHNDDEPGETEIDLPASSESLDEIVSDRLTLEKVAGALTAIAPDRAEALSLHIFGGLSMAEIGNVTGRSEAAAKMLVHRALSDLRQRLEHLREE